MLEHADNVVHTYQSKFDNIIVDIKEICKEKKFSPDLAVDICSKLETSLFQTGMPNPAFDLPVLGVRYCSNPYQLEELCRIYDSAMEEFRKVGQLLELEYVLEKSV